MIGRTGEGIPDGTEFTVTYENKSAGGSVDNSVSVDVTVSEGMGMGVFQATLEAGTYVFTVDQDWEDAVVMICVMEGEELIPLFEDLVPCGTEIAIAESGDYVVMIGRTGEGIPDYTEFTVYYKLV
jgi:hypothetical protein